MTEYSVVLIETRIFIVEIEAENLVSRTGGVLNETEKMTEVGELAVRKWADYDPLDYDYNNRTKGVEVISVHKKGEIAYNDDSFGQDRSGHPAILVNKKEDWT